MDTRALAGAAAALGLGAGLGIGYLLFHNDSAKTTPIEAPAAATATSSSTGGADFQLDGKLILKFSYGAFVRDESNACAGSGGYKDITNGAAVTITDQTGTVIATGALDAGHAEVDDNSHPTACTFTFEVPHVPDGKPFYGVTVSHRGAITYRADQAKGGQAILSLG